MSKTGKLKGVEALRGIAAMLVVAVHASHMLGIRHPQAFGQFWDFGRAGVDFFFVLSGFIITYIHINDLGRAHTFPSFWTKRLLRIFPVYWIITALFGLLLFLSPTPGRLEQNFAHIVFSALLLPEAADPILGVGWTLRHELLFYTLFSTVLLQRQFGMALLAAWGLGILWNMGFQLWSGTPYFNGLAGQILFRGFNIQFFFGIAVAFVVRSGTVWRPPMLAILGSVGFIATGLYESYGQSVMHEWPIRNLAYAASAMLVLYGVATLDKTWPTRVPALAVRLGAASYTIYLIHIPVLIVLEFGLRSVRNAIEIPSEPIFLVAVAVTAIIGIAFSEAVEQPLLRLGRRTYDKRSKGAVPASA